MLDGGGDVRAWCNAFLQLEMNGWKGQNGTALSNSPGDRQYFLDVMTAGFAKGRLFLASVTLDGKPDRAAFFFSRRRRRVLFQARLRRKLGQVQPWFPSRVRDHPATASDATYPLDGYVHVRPTTRRSTGCSYDRRTIQTLIIPMRVAANSWISSVRASAVAYQTVESGHESRHSVSTRNLTWPSGVTCKSQRVVDVQKRCQTHLVTRPQRGATSAGIPSIPKNSRS